MKKITVTLDNDIWTLIESRLAADGETMQDFAVNALREKLMK